MRIAFDPTKHLRTLEDRGPHFEDARHVFEGTTFEVDDIRKDYGERRVICDGLLSGRLGVTGYTPRSKAAPHLQHAKFKRS